ncbi:MAG: hypothetical protein JXA94_05090 [Parachlamydiales bacterium]|nr:hypothetical protein [Parachlamydiales bacterium]
MKYTSIQLFKKYFENPQEKVKLFLVVLPSSYERENVYDYILKKLAHLDLNIERFTNEAKIDRIINNFQSISFFGGEPLAIIDDLSSYKKEDILKLNSFIKSNNVYLLIGSEKKDLSIYATIEKQGLVFDLSQEKIWEKEKRYADYILDKCSRAKKNISSVVIQSLIEAIGLDLSMIDQETDKLITYVGDKTTIELDDIRQICITNISQNMWHIAEELVWKNTSICTLHIDSNFFYSLLSSVRYQLQMGLKIAVLIEENKINQLSKYFPKIYPRALEKKKETAAIYKSTYFKNALKELFDIDLLSKTANFDYNFLFDLLQTKLKFLKSYDTVRSS